MIELDKHRTTWWTYEIRADNYCLALVGAVEKDVDHYPQPNHRVNISLVRIEPPGTQGRKRIRLI